MSIEEALWEASRPPFRVRYIHDPAAVIRPPLYASFGVGAPNSARAKLARIVRGAPEVVVKVTGRQKGSGQLKAHFDYIGRKGKIEMETRDGEAMTEKAEIRDRAEEWSDAQAWRSRPTVTSVSLVFSMPAGTEPDKVLGAVRAVALAEFSDNYDYVLALHTDTPRPHVHLTVQAEGLDRVRFNPRPPQLHRLRERFAQALRDRGVSAEATPRRARGRRVAGSSIALVKLRARLRSEGSRNMPHADLKTNRQAIAVARNQAPLPPFVQRGHDRWTRIRSAYRSIAILLDGTGRAADRLLAADVHAFVVSKDKAKTTPEAFALRQAREAPTKSAQHNATIADRDHPRSR